MTAVERNARIQEDFECRCECGETNKVVHNGFYVCSSCGLEYEADFSEDERRSFTAEELNNRKRTHIVNSNYGMRTIIPKTKVDIKNNLLNPETVYKFRRISKINNNSLTSLERNLTVANIPISLIKGNLAMPFHVKDDAVKIYTKSAAKKLMRGRSIDEFVVASFYTSFKIHKTPYLLSDLTSLIPSDERNVNRCIRLINYYVLPEMGYNYNQGSITTFVERIGNELKIPRAIKQKAVNLVNMALANGLKLQGKDPKGVAGAAIYLSKQGLTQIDAASASKVTEVTLRTRAKELKKALNESCDKVFPLRKSSGNRITQNC